MIDPEFIELADLDDHELCEVLIPRDDMSRTARRRRRALEILLTRIGGARRRSYQRSPAEMEALLKGATFETRGNLRIAIKDAKGIDSSNYKKKKL